MSHHVDLDALEQLQKLAEPLPWKEDLYLTSDGDSVDAVSNNDGDMIVHTDESLLAEAFNCAYIVAACNSVPELVARVRELEKQMDWLAEFISNAFAGITPAKQFIEWAEQAAKEAGE